MIISRKHLRRFLLFGIALLSPVLAYAQYPQPTSLTASPSSIYRPGNYSLCAGNGANMTLDIVYSFSGGGGGPIYGWPSLDASGCATIPADSSTPVGTYTFTQARNTLNTDWVNVSTSVTVSDPPPQPTSLSFNPTSGYAGNLPCYTMTVGNGAYMTVDFQYSLNFVGQPTFTATMDANGQWSYCPAHYDITGEYDFTAIKNNARSDWVSIGTVSYYLWPPVPTSLSISPSSVTEGGTYRMTVGNGAQVLLNTQFNIGGGASVTVYNWPYLQPVSSGSPDGYADASTNTCMVPGAYNYTRIQNGGNGVWLSTAASVTLNAPGPPSISSVVPPGGTQSTSVNVTISGTNLCGGPASFLTTSWPGLTFSNFYSDPNSPQVTFNMSSSASLGTATVTLTAGGGSTTLTFTILPPLGLTKEYIYLGPRVIAVEAP